MKFLQSIIPKCVGEYELHGDNEVLVVEHCTPIEPEEEIEWISKKSRDLQGWYSCD